MERQLHGVACQREGPWLYVDVGACVPKQSSLCVKFFFCFVKHQPRASSVFLFISWSSKPSHTAVLCMHTERAGRAAACLSRQCATSKISALGSVSPTLVSHSRDVYLLFLVAIPSLLPLFNNQLFERKPPRAFVTLHAYVSNGIA